MVKVMRHTLVFIFFFFFNDPATTEIYPLPLHDALPISHPAPSGEVVEQRLKQLRPRAESLIDGRAGDPGPAGDGVDAEVSAAARHEHRAGRLENPGPRLIDRDLPAA